MLSGQISAFYGADVVNDVGVLINRIDNNTMVKIVDPFGKPAGMSGEWVKIAHDTCTGWVESVQVHVEYGS